jgi:FkbM family methyltransferase
MEKIKRTFSFIFNHPLGKKHPFKALLRFFLWQFQSRIFPSRLFIKQFIFPVKFYAKRGLTGITGNIYTGLHEFNDMAFLLHFLLPGDTFFDVGANAGSYTLLASGLAKARSVAIEPVKSTFDLLNKNIGLNELQDRVFLVNSGAGAAPGSLRFSVGEDTTNHVIAAGEQALDTVSVPVISLDSLLNEGHPVLIKIDVEGFETEVLKGMARTFGSATLKAIIIELNGSGLRYDFDENQVHHLLLSKNFRPFNYDPFTRTLTESPSYGNNNTIYCRDLKFINERVKNAGRISVFGELF